MNMAVQMHPSVIHILKEDDGIMTQYEVLISIFDFVLVRHIGKVPPDCWLHRQWDVVITANQVFITR